MRFAHSLQKPTPKITRKTAQKTKNPLELSASAGRRIFLALVWLFARHNPTGAPRGYDGDDDASGDCANYSFRNSRLQKTPHPVHKNRPAKKPSARLNV
jgi:hypothetical protein